MRVNLNKLSPNTLQVVVAYLPFFCKISERQFHQNLFRCIQREASRLAEGKGRGLIELPTPGAMELVEIYRSFFDLASFAQAFAGDGSDFLAEVQQGSDARRSPWLASLLTPQAVAIVVERYTPAMKSFWEFSTAMCAALLFAADWKTKQLLTRDFQRGKTN